MSVSSEPVDAVAEMTGTFSGMSEPASHPLTSAVHDDGLGGGNLAADRCAATVPSSRDVAIGEVVARAGEAGSCVDCSVYDDVDCPSCLGTGVDPLWMAHLVLDSKEDWGSCIAAELSGNHASDGACGDPDCCGDAYCVACSSTYPCITVSVLNSTDTWWRERIDPTVHIPVDEGICPACRLAARL